MLMDEQLGPGITPGNDKDLSKIDQQTSPGSVPIEPYGAPLQSAVLTSTPLPSTEYIEQSRPDSASTPHVNSVAAQSVNLENKASNSTSGAQEPASLSWTASEFIEHQKGVSWYIVLALVGLVLATADYLTTKDIFSVLVILIAAAMFGFYAARKPRTLSYQLDSQGLHIGDKLYDFRDFKNFSVTDEGAVASVVFIPLKRLIPPLTIYVSPSQEEQVLAYLSEFLPFERHSADIVDTLLHRIRF
jgi:hypothetical protein